MKPKKIPLRKCIGCQERFEKRNLVRIVKQKDGTVFLDKTNKANGRGAYICNDKDCLAIALKRKALARALETSISKELEEELIEAIDE